MNPNGGSARSGGRDAGAPEGGRLDDRRFTDDEVDEILRRASERQEGAAERHSTHPAPRTEGTSLAALQAVGSDVGIDPDHIRAAAREIAMGGVRAPRPDRFGIPAEVVRTRAVSGQIDAAEWQRIVSVLREVTGANGIASEFGAAREWVSSNRKGGEFLPLQLRLESREAGTVVEVRRDLHGLTEGPVAGALVFGALAAVLAVLFMVGDFGAAVWTLPASFGALGLATGVGGQWWARRHAVRRGRELDAVLDRISLIAADEETGR